MDLTCTADAVRGNFNFRSWHMFWKLWLTFYGLRKAIGLPLCPGAHCSFGVEAGSDWFSLSCSEGGAGVAAGALSLPLDTRAVGSPIAEFPSCAWVFSSRLFSSASFRRRSI